MPRTFSRQDWGAAPAKRGPGPLAVRQVEGLALHWPGMQGTRHTPEAIARALRSWQRFHQVDKQWSDIAYQVAIDQAGNRWQLRGLRTQSGANGSVDVNERFGAALLILGPGEQPTAAMVRGVQQLVRDFRELYPGGRRIVGHKQIRPEGTDCPGAATMALIQSRAFEPGKGGSDVELQDKIDRWEPGDDNPKDQLTVGMTLNQARGFAEGAYQGTAQLRSDVRHLRSELAELRELIERGLAQ